MNPEARRELNLLEAVEENSQVTQRSLASHLGMAVGLTNMYLKRLVRKGYIKCVSVRSNRLRYLITPTGIAEKTRLTYEYMEYSLRLYRETRQRFQAEMSRHLRVRRSGVAIYGTGEAAELAYLCLKELDVQPTAIFSAHGQSTFLSLPVLPIVEHASVPFDVLIVATLDKPSALIALLEEQGVARERMVLLRNP